MQRIVLGLKDIMIAASFLSCDVVEVVPGAGLKDICGIAQSVTTEDL
jgi:hypothetical protein